MKPKNYSPVPKRKISQLDYEELEYKVQTLTEALASSERLRRVENLSAGNFERFLLDNEPGVHFVGTNTFFPCATSVAVPGTGNGRFARQRG